jgi:hypothetical protein
MTINFNSVLRLLSGMPFFDGLNIHHHRHVKSYFVAPEDPHVTLILIRWK